MKPHRQQALTSMCITAPSNPIAGGSAAVAGAGRGHDRTRLFNGRPWMSGGLARQADAESSHAAHRIRWDPSVGGPFPLQRAIPANAWADCDLDVQFHRPVLASPASI